MKISGKRIIFCGELDSEKDVLRTISAYDSGFEMVSEESVYLEMDCFGEDFCAWLKAVDDFGTLRYFCVNSENVIITDRINGDVLACEPLDSFVWASFRAFCDEMEDDT